MFITQHVDRLGFINVVEGTPINLVNLKHHIELYYPIRIQSLLFQPNQNTSSLVIFDV